jgi:predicted cupin superfamily sugar epimerase
MSASGDLIARLGLQPHPEGGWYREVHRARATLPSARGTRSAITSIYFLLERGQSSRWHVVDSDEVWHHHTGAPLELLTYAPASRELHCVQLGSPGDAQEPIGVVPAGVWQAARTSGDFTLMGCDVGPGFDFADFRFVASLAGHRAHFMNELARFADLL